MRQLIWGESGAGPLRGPAPSAEREGAVSLSSLYASVLEAVAAPMDGAVAASLPRRKKSLTHSNTP